LFVVVALNPGATTPPWWWPLAERALVMERPPPFVRVSGFPVTAGGDDPIWYPAKVTPLLPCTMKALPVAASTRK
jgi:hypothetical protein